MKLKVKKLHEEAFLPRYATTGAACFDIYACLPDNDAAIAIGSHPTVTIPTGLTFEIPEGWAMQIYSRSGYGINQTTRLANCVDIIDSDFQGELLVKLHQDGERGKLFFVHGEAIARGTLVPVTRIEFDEVPEDED